VSLRDGSPFAGRGVPSDSHIRMWAGDFWGQSDRVVTMSYDCGFAVWNRDVWGEALHTWQNSPFLNQSNFWNGTGIVLDQGKIATCQLTSDNPEVKVIKVSHQFFADATRPALMHHRPQAAFSAYQKIGLVDLEKGQLVCHLKIEQSSTWNTISTIEAVPGSAGLVITQEGTGKIQLWDLNANSSKAIKTILGVQSQMEANLPGGLSFNLTNPNQIVSGANCNPLMIFDLGTGKAIHKLNFKNNYHKHYALYGNLVMQIHQGDTSTPACATLRLLNSPEEDLMGISCQVPYCCAFTTDSVIIRDMGTFIEATIPAQ